MGQHNKLRVFLPVLMIVFLLSGCNLAAISSDTPPTPSITPDPLPTATDEPGEPDEPVSEPTEEPADETEPSATPELTVAVPSSPTAEPGDAPSRGELIYETNFAAGWPEIPTDKGLSTTVENGYQFDLDPYWAQWTYTAVVERAAFYAETDVTLTNCPVGRGAYGLIFHYQTSDQFRYFVVTCDGDYLLYDRNLPEIVTLTSGNLPDSIDLTQPQHTLGILADENIYRLYVDNVEVASVNVTEMLSGDIGLYVETGADAVSILYTRLEIYEAP